MFPLENPIPDTGYTIRNDDIATVTVVLVQASIGINFELIVVVIPVGEAVRGHRLGSFRLHSICQEVFIQGYPCVEIIEFNLTKLQTLGQLQLHIRRIPGVLRRDFQFEACVGLRQPIELEFRLSGGAKRHHEH